LLKKDAPRSDGNRSAASTHNGIVVWINSATTKSDDQAKGEWKNVEMRSTIEEMKTETKNVKVKSVGRNDEKWSVE
jgi:hypothetical protein